jgi:hypothetical protein
VKISEKPTILAVMAVKNENEKKIKSDKITFHHKTLSANVGLEPLTYSTYVLYFICLFSFCIS